ncbi:CLN_G0000990.mRNA.1.CDS.1 [Saccharomyces cerevisiae]|nr:CLN_G0000990.mRNA.1.CDS.1 [Saccharomyces cerevisiae]CAI7130194.1 CLN_G0000990.mRNA.1.CDS.1 [Saccharomyces cerevisiae]
MRKTWLLCASCQIITPFVSLLLVMARVPIIARCIQVFFVFLIISPAFSPQLVLSKLSSDTILSGKPNSHRAPTSFDSPYIIRIV